MSTTRFEQDGLSVNTFAGPYEATNAKTRMHVQITAAGIYVQVDMDQWNALVDFIRRMDEAGQTIATAPEVP